MVWTSPGLQLNLINLIKNTVNHIQLSDAKILVIVWIFCLFVICFCRQFNEQTCTMKRALVGAQKGKMTFQYSVKFKRT